MLYNFTMYILFYFFINFPCWKEKNREREARRKSSMNPTTNAGDEGNLKKNNKRLEDENEKFCLIKQFDE